MARWLSARLFGRHDRPPPPTLRVPLRAVSEVAAPGAGAEMKIVAKIVALDDADLCERRPVGSAPRLLHVIPEPCSGLRDLLGVHTRTEALEYLALSVSIGRSRLRAPVPPVEHSGPLGAQLPA